MVLLGISEVLSCGGWGQVGTRIEWITMAGYIVMVPFIWAIDWLVYDTSSSDSNC